MHESGSVFVQISDENLHLVRSLMDEVFGRQNFYSIVVYQKTGGQSRSTVPTICDFVIWYCKDAAKAKLRTLFINKELGTSAETLRLGLFNWRMATFRPMT